MVDSGMWGHEAQYVLQNDAREFNFLEAYGHPGGPIIEGTIALQTFSHLPYDICVLIFVALFDSLIIAGACVLARVLREASPWWVAVLGVLSLNRLYDYATPPTAVATVLVVFLCLLTLYMRIDRERGLCL
jgi:hypothetical protein